MSDAPDPSLLDLMPFARSIGVELIAAGADEVRTRLAWRPQLCTAGGVLHGGALMALADTGGALCAYLNLPGAGFTTTTVESKTNFLRAVTGGHADAVSRPLQRGRRLIVVDTDIRGPDGRLAARVTQSQLVIAPTTEPPPPSR